MAPRKYEGLPKKIFGHNCSHYRIDSLKQLLTYYNKRHAASALKEDLLARLAVVEKGDAASDRMLIQRWMNQWPKPRQKFEVFLRQQRDTPVNAENSDPFMRPRSLLNDSLQRTGSSGSKTTSPFLKNIECIVCMESLDLDHFPEQNATDSCNHKQNTCKTCLIQSVESQVTSDVRWDQITCPECPELLGFQNVKALVSKKIFERYDQKSVKATFEHMQDFTLCLGPGCGSGQIHGGGNDQPIMTCTTCKFKTCFSHKMPWHSGQTCAEYDAERKQRTEQEAASESFLKRETKICPNPKCGLHCVKIIGCDHITCHHCKHEWCWLCFVPYTEIRRVGNTAHAAGCNYHPSNLPEAPDARRLAYAQHVAEVLRRRSQRT